MRKVKNYVGLIFFIAAALFCGACADGTEPFLQGELSVESTSKEPESSKPLMEEAAPIEAALEEESLVQETQTEEASEESTEKESPVEETATKEAPKEEKPAKETAPEEAKKEEASGEEGMIVGDPQKGGGATPGNLVREFHGRKVVIDAGHQSRGNSDKEPLGPGSQEMKKKVSSGTRGCVSGWYEYELNLVVALKLGTELQSRGYDVYYTRTDHDVNISNAERATLANDLAADAFIRIHANGSDNSSVSGAMTICQTADNPFNSAWHDASQNLSVCVLDEMVATTGCKRRKVWETDTMTGINWAQVPATIVEMGYMTNPEEDANMASEPYQDKIVVGIANGIDKYFGLEF